jgi:hypothetical protein
MMNLPFIIFFLINFFGRREQNNKERGKRGSHYRCFSCKEEGGELEPIPTADKTSYFYYS